MGEDLSIAAVTNDIFTREDAEFLQRTAVLPEGRVVGVETGGCPRTAIRDDVSMYLQAVEAMEREFPDLDLIFVESGGDNLAASFSPELVHASIYVIDVAGGDKVPRKGGSGVTRSELLVINKTDLAPLVGADLSVMDQDAALCAATPRRSLPPCCTVTGGRPSWTGCVGLSRAVTGRPQRHPRDRTITTIIHTRTRAPGHLVPRATPLSHPSRYGSRASMPSTGHRRWRRV